MPTIHAKLSRRSGRILLGAASGMVLLAAAAYLGQFHTLLGSEPSVPKGQETPTLALVPTNTLRPNSGAGASAQSERRIEPPRTLPASGQTGKPLPVPQNPLRAPTAPDNAPTAAGGNPSASWIRSPEPAAVRTTSGEAAETISPLELDGRIPAVPGIAPSAPPPSAPMPALPESVPDAVPGGAPPFSSPVANVGGNSAASFGSSPAPAAVGKAASPGSAAPNPAPFGATPFGAAPEYGTAPDYLPGTPAPSSREFGSSDARALADNAPPAAIPPPQLLANPPVDAGRIPPRDHVAGNAVDWRPGTDPASASNSGGTAASGAEGTARPGDASLEGPQTAQVTLQKILPGEIQVGKPAVFKIIVRNSGALTVPKVEVRDPIPWGVRVMRTTPQAARGPQGELFWSLGPLAPGDELNLETEVMPLQEGEIGSVATLSVITAASARATATRPQLMLRAQMPQQVMIGEEVTMLITISNPGSGTATGVVLEEHVPTELQHPAGTDLENWIGDLRPGETREVQLKLRAVRPGSAANLLVARAEGNLRVEDRTAVQVLAPQLDLLVEGATRRFLDRPTTYRITIRNPGTAPARNVHLTATLPGGMQFASANNAGSYDSTTHSVHWLLEELPTHQQGTVELTVVPIAVGTQDLACAARADLGLAAEKALPVEVEGLAAIHFQVADTVDPVELGRETGYEIRVVNQGTKAAENIQLAVVLPEGMRLIGAEGPAAHSATGDEVLFEKLLRLAPKAEVTYRLRVQAAAPGDHRIRVQLLSDDMQLPVTKEESTRIFTDQ